VPWGRASYAIARTIGDQMSEELLTRVTGAVRALAEDQGATIEAVALQVDLMTLNYVVADSAAQPGAEVDPSVVAGTVVLLLEDAANSLEEHPHAGTEPNRAAAARAALGLEAGTHGKPLRGRKGKRGRVGTVARWLNYETGSIFKPGVGQPSAFDALVRDVADYVVRREIAQRVKERRVAKQLHRPPLESAMRVDWLGRFERYYSIWSYIAGVRYDLELALAASGSRNQDELVFYCRKSLWYYARFLTDLEAFNVERGGLWVTPDPAAEQRIADAVWLLREPTPFSELDDSILRLSAASISELAVFFTVLDEPTLLALNERWQTWVQGCRCDLDQPGAACNVHAALEQMRTFMGDLDTQWDLLADWYDVPRPASQVDPPRVP
jgi:hypothetical protein